MEVHPSIPREGLQNIDTHIYVLRFNQQIGVIKILEINFFFFYGENWPKRTAGRRCIYSAARGRGIYVRPQLKPQQACAHRVRGWEEAPQDQGFLGAKLKASKPSPIPKPNSCKYQGPTP